MVVRNPLRFSMVLGLVGMSVAPSLAQTLVPLQSATATFSQTGFSVGTAIDGVTNDDLGWAIDHNEGVNQTAAFQTVSNVGAPGGSALLFTLTQNYSPSQHLLGKFRLSLTTDNRSTFADGLASGGNVTANWTVLNPFAVTSFNGSTLNILGDGSVLASGTAPNTDVYTISATTNLVNITGVRLEALPDASLPVNGPGRQPANGNFVLSEFTVAIAPNTPEPGSLGLLLGMVVTGTGLIARRRKKVRKAVGAQNPA